jgi:hypothetical protein
MSLQKQAGVVRRTSQITWLVWSDASEPQPTAGGHVMAPEFPPSVVIFNAHLENDRLQGTTEYIEPESKGDRPTWYWSMHPPEAQPVGDGVAFVSPEFTCIRGLYLGPSYEGEHRYTWSEGLNAGIPWVLFAIVLPRDYTLSKMNPAPAGSKLFGNRLALYWVLRGDDQFGRTQVSWTLSPLQSDLNLELVRLNRLKSNLPKMGADSLTVEDESSTGAPNSSSVPQRNPWKSGSFYLVVPVIILAGLVWTY